MEENVLLRLCRTSHRLSRPQVASKLGLTPEDYKELETGVTFMTPKEAKVLAELYNIRTRDLLESSRQLELLNTRAEVIKHLNNENIRLNQFMEGGYELVHNNKMRSGTETKENACYEQTSHQ